jgi:putative inorganic carbon (HCO3(-)) transporter
MSTEAVAGPPRVGAPRSRQYGVSAAVGIVAAACLATVVIGIVASASPKYGIEAVIGLAFIPLAVRQFTFATALFIVSTFLSLSGAAQKGIGFILIIVAAAQIAEGRRAMPNFFADHKGLAALILGFLMWATLGLIWAISSSTVITSLTRYVPNFLIFFVLYAAIRDRRDARLLVGVYVLGSAIAAGAAIVLPAQTFDGVPRAGGFFGDPNDLAAVLVSGLALAAAMTRWKSVPRVVQLGAGIAAVMCLVGILLSVSRGGLVALGVTLVAGACFAGRWRPYLVVATMLVLVVVVGYFIALAPSSARSRLSASSDNSSGRTTIWKVGWREVQHHPITGVGAGNFSIAGTQYLNEPGALIDFAPDGQGLFIDRTTVAHNTYLETLAEDGIPGFLLFMGIVVCSLDCARRAAIRFRANRDEEMELVSYGLLCGTIGYLSASFFLTEIFSKQLYLLLALGPVLLLTAGLRGASARPARVTPTRV